jgi:hypothetical protein
VYKERAIGIPKNYMNSHLWQMKLAKQANFNTLLMLFQVKNALPKKLK